MSDMSEAFQTWIDNVNTATAQSAFMKASEQANQIKNSNLKDYEKQFQIQGLGTHLAGVLSMSGVNPTSAKLTGESVTGGLPPQPKDIDEALLSPVTTIYERGKNAYDEKAGIENRYDMKKLKAEQEIADTKQKTQNNYLNANQAALNADRDAMREITVDNQARAIEKDFHNYKDVGALSDAWDKNKMGKAMLSPDSPDSQATIALIQNQLSRASGDTRLSDQDRKALNFNPSYWNQIKKSYDVFLSNKTLPEDKKVANDLLDVMEHKVKSLIKQKIDGYTKDSLYPKQRGGDVRLKKRLEDYYLNGSSANKDAPANGGIDINKYLID